MTSPSPCVLAINAGSSSIRFAVYEVGDPPRRRLDGKIDRIGARGTTMTVRDPWDGPSLRSRLPSSDHRGAVTALLRWLEAHPVFASVEAIGHRVVHGMRHAEPQRITARLIAGLRRVTPLAPEHLPRELALIAAFRRRHPRLAQVACFDTAFHRTLPAVARVLPIPRRYGARGVERYGFHGLSYQSLMETLGRLDPRAATGRVVLAHLGNGASLAAVHGGRSIDTTMGFTPASGLVMGTRAGDVDPGLVGHLGRTEGMTAAGFQRMATRESGLLGVSGTTADVGDLLEAETRDTRAAEALAIFCYQVKKGIGAYAAALGGLETLVFAGGIGEHAPPIRARICEGLGFLGIELDPARNRASASRISRAAGRVTVRVIPTDEEQIIARAVVRLRGRGAAAALAE